MSNKAKFEVFRITVLQDTLSNVPDPREHESWAMADAEEQSKSLAIYEGSLKGNIKYFSATVTDVSDENSPISKTVTSDFFDISIEDGSEQLAYFLHLVNQYTHARYNMICPVQKVEKRLIEWGNVVSVPKNFRSLN